MRLPSTLVIAALASLGVGVTAFLLPSLQQSCLPSSAGTGRLPLRPRPTAFPAPSGHIRLFARKGGRGDVKEDREAAAEENRKPPPLGVPSIFRELLPKQQQQEGLREVSEEEEERRLQRLVEQQQSRGAPIALPNKPNLTMITFGIGVALVLGVIGLGIGRFVGVEPLAGMSLDIEAIGLGAGLAIPLFLVDAFLQKYQEDTASEVYALSIFGTSTPIHKVVLLAGLMTLATGFGEEVLFRGLVQQGLSANVGSVLGVLGASVVFGLAHKLGPSDLAFITFSGLWMGLAYEVTGDITVPIFLHAVYDLLILTGAYLRGTATHQERVMNCESSLVVVVVPESEARMEGSRLLCSSSSLAAV